MKPKKFLEIESNTIGLIAEKYQRSEESLRQDVATLKNWMRTQPHLPEILDDKSLQNFLISNKCSIERAKQKIDMYYTLRSQIPEFYESINPRCANMKQTIEIAQWVLLPKLNKNMYRMWFFKLRNKELIDKIEPRDIMGLTGNLQELRLKEDLMYGDVIIFDMEGMNFGFLSKLTPSVMMKMFAVYEKIWSIPMKAMFVLNSPPFISTVMGILKSTLKPKIFDRIVVCKDTSILSERFSKDEILKDYGGEAPSVEELCELLKEKLHQYQSRFDELDKLRTNENLRPEKLKNDEVLGFYGNFKKLDVD